MITALAKPPAEQGPPFADRFGDLLGVVALVARGDEFVQGGGGPVLDHRRDAGFIDAFERDPELAVAYAQHDRPAGLCAGWHLVGRYAANQAKSRVVRLGPYMASRPALRAIQGSGVPVRFYCHAEGRGFESLHPLLRALGFGAFLRPASGLHGEGAYRRPAGDDQEVQGRDGRVVRVNASGFLVSGG